MSEASPRVAQATSRSGGTVRSVLSPASFVAQPAAGVPAQAHSAADRSRIERLGHDFGRVAVHRQVMQPSSNGHPLPEPLQRKMESAFGHDFSGVRVHQGPEASSIGAVAFTRGTNIHFAPGRFDPHSREGQRLLGHELTHVVQQRAGKVAVPRGGGVPINDDPGHEAEADAMGARAAEGKPASVGGSAEGVQRKAAGGGVIQRQDSDEEESSSSGMEEEEEESSSSGSAEEKEESSSSGSDEEEEESSSSGSEEEEEESSGSDEETPASVLGKRKRSSSDSGEDSGEEADDEGSSSGEEEDGSDYEESLKAEKRRPPDPNAKISGATTSKKVGGKNVYGYRTVGGAQHEETHDPKTSTTTTVTTGLTLSDRFRNNAKRPSRDASYYNYNHYNLSVGQSGLNQAVGSHQTPSWLGMNAGGEHRNVDMTSGEYNKQVEKAEKGWRPGVKKTHKHKYETTTQKERIVDNLRAREISEQKGMRWSKGRIKKRLNRLVEIHPDEQRVVSQQRQLTDETTGGIGGSLALGVDYHYGLPARASSEKAQQEYKKARGESSNESDSELYPDPPKGKPGKGKPPKKKQKKNDSEDSGSEG